MIAEDDLPSRILLKSILEKAGYETSSAENGVEALNLFRQRFYPIVITDWMMPEMDGLDLCRAVRQEKTPGYVFIIIITARNSKEAAVEGLDAGADDFLSKPYNHMELLARIRTGIRVIEMEKNLLTKSKKIEELSLTDGLTGAYNRAYINKNLKQELERAKRYSYPLSIALIDLDHFKNINDSFGHTAGDVVLKRFVNCILESIREDIDWLARYGGEEFILVLPHTGCLDAAGIAERLREAISSMRISHGDHTNIAFTASFGISSFEPGEAKSNFCCEDLIDSADKLLYKCKMNGRNMVLRTSSG